MFYGVDIRAYTIKKYFSTYEIENGRNLQNLLNVIENKFILVFNTLMNNPKNLLKIFPNYIVLKKI